jgi:hypothetical protein
MALYRKSLGGFSLCCVKTWFRVYCYGAYPVYFSIELIAQLFQLREEHTPDYYGAVPHDYGVRKLAVAAKSKYRRLPVTAVIPLRVDARYFYSSPWGDPHTTMNLVQTSNHVLSITTGPSILSPQTQKRNPSHSLSRIPSTTTQ